jgi:hypothetical protein
MQITDAACKAQAAARSIGGMVALTMAAKQERPKIPGAWVKAARKAAGDVPQSKLVELTGRDRVTVYRWEKPTGGCDPFTWRGILSALGLPSDWQPPEA